MEGKAKEIQVFGIPGCLTGDAKVVVLRGKRKGGRVLSLEDLFYKFNKIKPPYKLQGRTWTDGLDAYCLALKSNGLIGYELIQGVVDSGYKNVVEVLFENGSFLTMTPDHEVYTEVGFRHVVDCIGLDIFCRDLNVVSERRAARKERPHVFLKAWPFDANHKAVACRKINKDYAYYRVRRSRLAWEAHFNGLKLEAYINALNAGKGPEDGLRFLSDDLEVHHIDGDCQNDDPSNLLALSKREHARLHGEDNQKNFKNVEPGRTRIATIEKVPYPVLTFDIQMAEGTEHNFIANDIVVHNSGKTTYLTKVIKDSAAKNEGKGDHLVVSSFTKTAAAELVDRELPVPPENVGTLHAICYRLIGRGNLAEKHVDDFNKENPKYALSKSISVDTSESQPDMKFGGNNDATYNKMQILRAKLRCIDSWPDERTKTMYKLWTEWKEANEFIDFTDMIEIALKNEVAPPEGVRVGIFDEVQDFTPMQMALIRMWADKYLEYIMICGDDDQCSAPGTMVETSQGQVPIEDLPESGTGIVTYCRSDARIYGRKRKGTSREYSFNKVERHYFGTMYKVAIGNAATSATSNHIWLTKWSEKAKSSKVCCTYLMRKGDHWRVGWCQLFRSDGCFHLGARARLENADAMWIVRTHEDRTEASVYESYLATQWGLPTITFRPVNGAAHFTEESIDAFFNMLSPEEMRLRASAMLAAHGRSIAFPFREKKNMYLHQAGQSIFHVRSCNLLPGFMLLPVPDKSTAKWTDFTVTESQYSGPVYSLDVEKHHTYVADGIITHNCLFSFTGASPDTFLNPGYAPYDKKYLDQSYRVPKLPLEAADRWVRKLSEREAKTPKPRVKENGEVAMGCLEKFPFSYKQAGMVRKFTERILDTGKTVMILASCGYMLNDTIAELKKAGIPFANRFRRSFGAWNPLGTGRGLSTAKRLWNYLTPQGGVVGGNKIWTPEQLHMWTDMCEAKSVFQTGKKASFLAACKDNDMSADSVVNLMLDSIKPEHVDVALALKPYWLWKHLVKDKRKVIEFPMAILERLGKNALIEEPKVTIGTIHSVKGGQADYVILFPDISANAALACQNRNSKQGIEAKDAVIRQFYVGMTRCREGLYVANNATPLYAPIINP